MAIRSNWFLFLVLTLVVFLHAKARELPKPKNLENQKKDVVVVAPEKSTNVVVKNTNNPNPAKDVAKGNDDDKHFISFAGVGAAGGVGGAAGIIPIDFQGLGPGIPTFGGLGGSGLGGGTGGGGGIGGGVGGGGGCTPGSSTTGGLVPIP